MTSPAKNPYERGLALPEGLITRRMLLTAAGLTESELRALTAQGLVHATKRTSYGWYLYPKEMVEKAQKYRFTIKERPKKGDQPVRLLPVDKSPVLSYSAEEALDVVRRVEDGETLVKVFLDTKMHPAIINAIVKDYENMKSAIIVPKAVVDEINKLPLEGSFPVEDAKQLLAVLKKNAAALVASTKCYACKKKSRTHCLPCAKRMLAPKDAAPETQDEGSAPPAP